MVLLRRSYEVVAEAALYLLAVDLVFAHLHNGEEYAQIVQRDERSWRIEGRLQPTPQIIITVVDN